MYIKKLSLIQYRNYINESFNFSPGLNIIVGENAQGKTNLIESMYVLSRGYSHRGSSVTELTHFEKSDFSVKATIINDQVSHELSLKNIDGKKKFLLNGKSTDREKINRVLTTILFEPGDLKIVKEGPDKRRRFLNEEISGFNPQYHYLIKNYEKVLMQRNQLLKNITYQPSLSTTLPIWNEQLIDLGIRIIRQRVAYLHRLNREAGSLYQVLSEGRENLSLYYHNNIIDSLDELNQVKEKFFQKLKTYEDEEIKKGSTIFGPHVDDMLIQINNKDARRFGSQGQQRSAAIALKLSQIKIVQSQTGFYPVVLLDDIFSELDEKRRKNILRLIESNQSFITGTEDISEELKRNVINIRNGKELEF
ncbi:DNA replication/repair protein RecF [Eubacteriaceae bacterium ES3]|nr:DNA replication/repair protein RecF [Eubacteriaceae bacterium ES3]